MKILRSSLLNRALQALCCVLLLSLSVAKAEAADEFKIAVMQDRAGAIEEFRPLEKYLLSKGIQTRFVPTESYPQAAKMFAEGKVDGMFSGSAVAGTMILKKVAYPIARPVSSNGTSTYWATIVAPKGAPKFKGSAEYFSGKKVAFCALASSGDIFFRSLPHADKISTASLAPSHGAAIEAVNKGEADVAIVKNLVWYGMKDRYPRLEEVGTDSGQNPNNTLIVSNHTDKEFLKRLLTILLGLQNDRSPEASAAKEGMGIRGYIVTSAADFSHTLGLLKRAGVDENFDFRF